MAPTIFEKRRYCDPYVDPNCDGNYNYSTWNDWGRWVALAVLIGAFLLIAFAFSCINSRRRRRRGLAPMYGTGWIPGSKPHGGQQYGNHNQQYGGYYQNQPYHGGAPAPPYTPGPVPHQQTGTTFNSNDGYYGNRANNGGIELQQPQNAYAPQRGGDPVYEAPLGPPPTKGDGIIR